MEVYCLSYNYTNNLIDGFVINTNQIINIINQANPQKAGGNDGISVAMLQLCKNEVAVPLRFIFQECLSSGMLPDCWKCANVQPVHKKTVVKTKKIIEPYHSYQFAGKLSKRLFLIKSILSWFRIIYNPRISRALGLEILLYTSCCP